jgi:hypothetical protein
MSDELRDELGEVLLREINTQAGRRAVGYAHIYRALDALKASGYEVTRWRTVPGHPKYEVSERGEIRSHKGSLPRYVNPVVNHEGRMVIDIGRKKVFVHSLVLKAFIGPRPDGMVIRHLDGNPANNRLDNLAYGSQSENLFDAVRHGTNVNAGKTHCPKGHPYSGDNLQIGKKKNGNTYRLCRICKIVSNQKSEARRRAAAANAADTADGA